jgi:hypothetical protein
MRTQLAGGLQVLMIIVSTAIPSLATTYYVATTGSDNNAGTELAPFQTIQKGIDTATAGDTVQVAEGTYYENLFLNGKDITLRSSDPDNQEVVAATIIDGSTGTVPYQSVVHFNGDETPNCLVTGLTLRRGRGYRISTMYATRYWGGGIVTTRSADTGYPQTQATIKKCVIRENQASVGGGVALFGGLIEDSIIEKNVVPTIYGESWDNYGGGFASCNGLMISRCIIRNNIVWSDNNSSGGGGLASITYGTMRDSLITGNVDTGFCGSGINLFTGSIENCTFGGNSDIGCTICAHTYYAYISNTLVWGNMDFGWSRCPIIGFDNTPLAHVTYSCIGGYTSEVYPGQGNILANPSYANPFLWADYTIASNDSDKLTVYRAPWYPVGTTIEYDDDGVPRMVIANDNATLTIDPPLSSSSQALKIVHHWGSNVTNVNEDWHIDGSSCYDAGDPNYVPQSGETDLDGNPRISGNYIDMGAYEIKGPVVSGTINLQDFLGDKTAVPITIELRNPGETTPLEVHTGIRLDSNESYSFRTERTGTFDVTAKAFHWLRQKQASVNVTTNVTVNFSLINGDINNDNTIGIEDYSTFTTQYNTAGPEADLNGSGWVTIEDYSILTTNYGLDGDD